MRPFSLIAAAVVLIAALLAVAAPSSAAVCTNSTVVGTYAVNLAGVATDGTVAADFAFVTMAANGGLVATVYANGRGHAPTSFTATGAWAVNPNCVMSIAICGLGRFDSAIGYVSNNGGVIQFATATDALAQLTGIGFRVQ